MDKPKKIVLSAILLLILIGGALAANSKQILSIISGIEASDSPVIANAFTDKDKYFPGDTMAITAETKNASEVKAFVENEKGFNEVNLVVAASFNGKETWTGKWKVENTLSGKKYNLKIVAYNKSGTAETVLEWEDPNPGHPWSEIDNFPAACGANQYVRQIGATPTCATPSTLSADGSNCATGNYAQGVDASGNAQGCAASGSPTTWDCTTVSSSTDGTSWDGTLAQRKARCPADRVVVGGRCVFSPGFPHCNAPIMGTSSDNAYSCGCYGAEIYSLYTWAKCCK